jgi:hypothetical protein
MPSLPVIAGMAVVVLVLLAIAVRPRTEVRHPAVALLRVLVPSWRFFDDLQVTPRLAVRVAHGDGYGPWTILLDAPPRRLVHVLWNPRGNLVLAQHALLERLQMEAGEVTGDPETLRTTVSYELVLNLVRGAIAADARLAGAARCQFKLVAPRHYEHGAAERAWVWRSGDDVLISAEHET